ncbi:unnamed protein product [Soboliphyme baturini]|uniref:WH2 domain-containing protein n=1 Tax=Soboliphyme baturini TaxID=241478 RepID=A0A183J8G1_9BILA|nr:unnamed protein product [Soboliphyme baturini]
MRESVIVRPKAIASRRGSSVASRNTSTSFKVEPQHADSQRNATSKVSSNGRPDRGSHGTISLQSSLSGGSFELMSSMSSSQRPPSGSLNGDLNSVGTNNSDSCDSAEQFERRSFENAFEMDGSTTGTIKRQPLKSLPAVVGIGGAKLPLTESTKQIHNAATRRKASSSSSLDSCLRTPISDHPKTAPADAAEPSSPPPPSKTISNMNGSLCDDELPPPPLNQMPRSVSIESFNDFPPPPSPLMLQNEATELSLEASYHQVRSGADSPPHEVTMRRTDKGSDRLKPPPPPPPKRSESTRISTRIVSDVGCSSCEICSSDTPVNKESCFRPVVPMKPTAFNNRQSSVNKSRLSTDESSFQNELQRAMQRRLQKLQNMPA